MESEKGGGGAGFRRGSSVKHTFEVFLNEELTCPGCGKKHWRTQKWVHEKCAINKSAINKVAINAVTDHERRVVGELLRLTAEVEESDREIRKQLGLRTQNRRARDAYNKYMREYMRKRRGKA